MAKPLTRGTRYIEEGAALIDTVAPAGTADLDTPRRRPLADEALEAVPVVVVGAGQAGLSVGYHLKRRAIPFVILDANDRVGDQWRRRWDSLRLFTPARYDGLDGMRFPAPVHDFPTKDAMADFLEAYAARFALPVRTGVRVDRLDRQGDGYVVAAGAKRFEARHVVVAMSHFQAPKVPPFAAELAPDIVQLHSAEYRNPTQMREGDVLLVGAGNSASEIARELATVGHTVWMSGRGTGHIPFRIDGFMGRHLLVRLVLRVLFYRVLTTDTPIGRRARPKVLAHGGPLIRVKPKDLAALGVKRVPRTAGTRDGRPLLEDDRVLDVANVVWCTGFRPGFDWIRRPVFDDHGEPLQNRGVVSGEPGLYFTGLEFLYAYSSVMIHGAGRDARYVADRIAERMGAEAQVGAGRP